ncbi:sugar ABC transporter ATP-binding protein [Glaciecola siphonariae]|uniref:Sugar ABC transporter ATP-binding protein n=1 Tax=Glaciecola siphonariae TaxID=521012 RepID=A0ABV9LXP2_9ALTE
MTKSTPRLQISNLHKSYNVPVLKGIAFDVKPGEIFGIVGENGAGKSTLINILCGLVNKNKGKLFIDAQPYSPASVSDAMTRGVSVALQELSLIDDLNIAENISLRRLPHKASLIKKDELNRRAHALLESFGLSELNLTQKVADLSLAQKQLVEICKALSEPTKLLILDEPTAALSLQQSDLLHAHMHSLASAGMSIIYVSHRLSDVLTHCTRVSVLRDGQLVNTCRTEETSTDQLIEWMSKGALHFAKSLNPTQSLSSAHQRNESVLIAKNLTSHALPVPINLSLLKGETLGIAGLAGAGRTELLEALYGLTPLASGQVIRLHNQHEQTIASSTRAVDSGMGMLSEDRKQQGIFAQQPLHFNCAISALERVAKRTFIQQKTLKQICDSLFNRLAIKHDSQNQDIESLSGGNQQKVLLARWLFAKTEVFLLDEPTRGVDVATKALIYEELKTLTQNGASCIVASSEIEELFTLCDRIIVMSNKQIVGQLTRDEFDMDKVLQMAFSKVADSFSSAVTPNISNQVE